MGKQKAANLEVLKKAMLRYRKALGLAVLVLVSMPLLAQSTGVETLGAGTPSTTCGRANYACVAPVNGSDGPDGTLAIFVGSKNLMRYDLEGGLVWSSNDYDGFHFTHDGIGGTLSYTLASITKPCGGSGRWTYTCRYNWVSGGSLTE